MSDTMTRAASGRSGTGAPVHVWVCRHCGKRSYAKRDPIAHKRWEAMHDGAFDASPVVGRRAIWCGPFDRYVVTLDTSRPQRDELPHFGQPTGAEYRFQDADEDDFPF